MCKIEAITTCTIVYHHSFIKKVKCWSLNPNTVYPFFPDRQAYIATGCIGSPLMSTERTTHVNQNFCCLCTTIINHAYTVQTVRHLHVGL